MIYLNEDHFSEPREIITTTLKRSILLFTIDVYDFANESTPFVCNESSEFVLEKLEYSDVAMTYLKAFI